MINIRHGLFETNSSSVHSMTLLTQDEYKKWESGDYYLDGTDKKHGIELAISQRPDVIGKKINFIYINYISIH